MRFTFNPESKLQERVGQVAVTVLLVAVFLISSGCGDSSGDEGPVVTSQPAADRGTTVARTVEPRPEPVSEPVATTAAPRVVSFENAQAAFRDRRFGESVELFTAYVDDKPDNPWGHYMLGLAAWKNGELDRAELALRRALELDGNHVKSYVNLGRVLLEQKRPDEARDAALEAVDIDPVSTDGYRVLGLAYDAIGDTDSAIAAYREALVLDEGDAWSMNNLGLLYIREGRFEDALGPLVRAVELRDDVAIFHNNLGIALERTGYLADAADQFELAVTANPDHTKSIANLERVRDRGDDEIRINRVQLAQAFADEIQRWRDDELASVDFPETERPTVPESQPTDPGLVDTEISPDSVTVDSAAIPKTMPTDSVTTGLTSQIR